MKELLGQGRTAEQMRAHEDMADALAFWVIRCACAVFLVSLFCGCAEIRIETVNGVRVHWNDLSPCAAHSTGCYVRGEVYVTDLDPQALGHEMQHHAGMDDSAWFSEGGRNCTMVTRAGAGWKVGDKICRTSSGAYIGG